jgi:hypothetical protein
VAVATHRWKLEYYVEDGRGRLFDRKHDPREQNDLFDSSAYMEVRNKLLKGLLTWYADASDLVGLVQRSFRAGPIGRRAVSQMKDRKGVEAEERLNRICQEADRIQI